MPIAENTPYVTHVTCYKKDQRYKQLTHAHTADT